MLRKGSCKPGSWSSFWAILALVGLVTRAGEWAVRDQVRKRQGLGARTSARSYIGLARRWSQPAGPREHGETGHLQGQRERGHTAFQGKRGWAAGGGLNDKKTLYCSLSQAAGSRQRPHGDAISIQVLRSDSWGGGAREAGLGNSPPAAAPFLPC